MKRNRATYAAAAGAAAAQILLMCLVIPSLGATGAAIAYAVSMGGMYGACAWMARRTVLQLMRAPAIS
jgi:O-antigen/teichoic acid export membrane protein